MLFADTGALFAFLVRGDTHHADAVRAEAYLRSTRDRIWTIDAVLTELWLLLRREVNARISDNVVRGLLDAGVRREAVEDRDYVRAWLLATEWSDQDFSLTDRLAFAVLERTRRYRAWSYDTGFAIIRLGPARNQPLELIR